MTKTTLSVRPLDINSSKDVDRFIKFAWTIYKNNPYWVPPLLMDIKKTINPKNPFFEFAQMQLFVAEQDGKIVGRIAAIKNDAHNRLHNENAGHFGFFECPDDQTIANTLFDTATDWCRKQGLNYIIGPANPSINHEYGLLVNAFDDSPRLMMSYNPPYYKKLIENYGFTCIKGLNAYKLDQDKVLSNPKLLRISQLARERTKVKIRSINMKNLKQEVALVKSLFNAAWEKNWGAIPMTDREIDDLAQALKDIADPDLIIFAEIGDKTVGFALAMRDYNYIFKQMNGRLFPFNFLKLFTQKNKIEWVRILLLGLLPDYRRTGLDAVLYHEIAIRSRKFGIKYGEASWILEDNLPMVRAAEDVMTGECYKRYEVFGKNI